jgi:hypothetical protein
VVVEGRAIGREAAMYVVVCTPAGFERYFERLQAEITGTDAPPEAAGALPETIVVGPQIEAP